ncbi:MAG: 6-carboxytetrahydropterin synthase [Kangiellaceae bacterium]|nr:6-carboxytetrahydropterin synthase [Kangiellaceae bacterium]
MPALFVDQLTVIDFAFFDPKRGIVGESWIVDVVLEGDLDDQGMVFDFGDVKKRIKLAIDNSVDHKFVVPANYSELSHELNDDELLLELRDSQGRWYRHQSPPQAVVLLEDESVNQAAVTELLIEECFKVVPDNVHTIELHLSTENIAGDYYHYAHGLKKHLGDCQRIAHGHRSQIHIFENGQRSQQLEQFWCEKWQDIYIGTQEDLVQEIDIDGIRYNHFAYHSEQGSFSLTLPQDKCHMMVNDSTVELIAAHIVKQLKHIKPHSDIRVKAFEGVNKGAIARG